MDIYQWTEYIFREITENGDESGGSLDKGHLYLYF